MSYKIGMDTVNLKPTERLAHMEYCSNLNLIKAVTGTGAQTAAGDSICEEDISKLREVRKFNELWEIDMLWNINDGPVPWSQRGRVTDMGHAEFLEGGVDVRRSKPCPFNSPQEVWEFDAVKEYGLPDMDELVAFYEAHYLESQHANPEQVFTGGYYRTIFSGAIDAFGWDMLLMAAADQNKFERVLDSFFRLSLHHCEAWAKTSIEVFLSHDDMVWTEGAFIHPDFYRRVVFPRYRQLWSVLKKAGKKVLFCADGTWTQFVDDIADAGADGFVFEPTTSLDYIAANYGQTHIISGSKVDCRTLTFGTIEDIKSEIDATLTIALKCPGFIFTVGNHIASNVPVENAIFYFEYLKKNWFRR